MLEKVAKMKQLVLCLIVTLCLCGCVTTKDRINQLDSQIRQLEAEQRAKLHKEIELYRNEKNSTCTSKNLTYAGLNIHAFELSNDRIDSTSDYDSIIKNANMALEAIFELADLAKERRCYKDADKLYRHVIERYVGVYYSGFRDRARIGIDDIRGLQKIK
ncbi:MAG: hypothetical protein ABTQ34_05985 [Bdellovibrionales bacterium]